MTVDLDEVLAGLRATSDLLGDRSLVADLPTDASTRRCTTLVAGEFKQGKSSLVNCLVGYDVSPVDVDRSTSVPVVVHGADASEGAGEPVPRWHAVDPDGRHLLDLGGRDAVVLDGARPDTTWIEAVIDAADARGLALLDAPGLGGLASAAGAAAASALGAVDAMLLVTDGQQELQRAEVEFLREAVDAGTPAAVVLTKIDVSPHWRTVHARDVELLAFSGLQIPVLATSAQLYALARARSDADLLREAGLAAVHTWLEDRRLAAADAGRQPIARLALAVLDRVRAAVANERAVHQAETAGASGDRVRSARHAAKRLASSSAHWQQAITDGINDLEAQAHRGIDMIRREVTRVADQRIATGDPARGWEEFENWFSSLIAERFGRLHAGLVDGLERLFAEVEATFEDAERDVTGELGELAYAGFARPGTAAGLGDMSGSMVTGSWTRVETLQMFGLQATLLNPVALVVVVAMGRKLLREQRERRVEARREQARSVVRMCLDDVAFEAEGRFTDELRKVRRDLRSALAGRATAVEQAIDAAEALAATHQGLDAEQRATRLVVLDEADRRLVAMRMPLVAAAGVDR